jgi:arylsulfatase A-like enzyme
MSTLSRALVLFLAVVAATTGVHGSTHAAAKGGAPSQPNIVLVLTDDQAERTMDAMPTVNALIRQQGVRVEHAVIPTSTCCPSRSALLTGKYARSTGVYANTGPHGGWGAFKSFEDQTLAVALDKAGYRTGLFGKYMNGWVTTPESYVPAGWDEFMAIRDPNGNQELGAGAYYNYFLTGTQPTQWHAREPEDYSTDVLAGLAVDFISTTDPGTPLFLMLSTSGPHRKFATAPRHKGLWHNEPLNPAVTQLTEPRPSFMPDIVQPYLATQRDIRKQHEALMSVDEAVGQVVDALGDRAGNTLFVYMSDNGLQFGEHGLRDKYVPYSGSTDVPLLLRWDGVLPARATTGKLMTNADVAVTIADAAGVTLSSPDGRSYWSSGKRGVVLEAVAASGRPGYCGWRSKRWLFVEWSNNKGRELYDYRSDPYELHNLAREPAYWNQVLKLRHRTMQACSPVPPGFTW